MERKQTAWISTILGIAIFLGSMLFLLPIVDFYLLALVLMFVGVILIGIGGATLKDFDKSLDNPPEECYYCNGTGQVDGSDGKVICARCGGTGYFSDETD